METTTKPTPPDVTGVPPPATGSTGRSCRDIEREYTEAHHVAYSRRNEEMLAAKFREFPVGTEVTWRHGLLTVRGKVVRLPDYIADAVDVQRHGAKHPMQKRAYELTPSNNPNLPTS